MKAQDALELMATMQGRWVRRAGAAGASALHYVGSIIVRGSCSGANAVAHKRKYFHAGHSPLLPLCAIASRSSATTLQLVDAR